MNNVPQLGCELDCRFGAIGCTSTLMYYPPSYDKEGRNTNPDKNIRTSYISCRTCGKQFVSKSYAYGEMIENWKEITTN